MPETFCLYLCFVASFKAFLLSLLLSLLCFRRDLLKSLRCFAFWSRIVWYIFFRAWYVSRCFWVILRLFECRILPRFLTSALIGCLRLPFTRVSLLGPSITLGTTMGRLPNILSVYATGDHSAWAQGEAVLVSKGPVRIRGRPSLSSGLKTLDTQAIFKCVASCVGVLGTHQQGGALEQSQLHIPHVMLVNIL